MFRLVCLQDLERLTMEFSRLRKIIKDISEKEKTHIHTFEGAIFGCAWGTCPGELFLPERGYNIIVGILKLPILKFWTPNHPTLPCPTEATAIHLPSPWSETWFYGHCKHIIKIATENTTYHRFVCLHQIEMHFSDILKWILMAGKDQEWQICASKFNTNRFTTITKPKTLFPSVCDRLWKVQKILRKLRNVLFVEVSCSGLKISLKSPQSAQQGGIWKAQSVIPRRGLLIVMIRPGTAGSRWRGAWSFAKHEESSNEDGGRHHRGG